MWSTGGMAGPYLQKGIADPWIARSADLHARSSDFDHSLASLHQIVSTHRGYLEDLRTESRSGLGRALAATVSVPSNDFDATLADLKSLGRVEGVSEAGEDFAVKLATEARRLAAAQTNLSRLQKLQRERKGELRDVAALEKDIAQANEAVLEAERQNQELVSTVAQALSASPYWKITAPLCRPILPANSFSFAILSSRVSAAFSPPPLSFSASSLNSVCHFCSGLHCSSFPPASPGAASVILRQRSPLPHERSPAAPEDPL